MTRNDLISYGTMIGISIFGFLIMYWAIGLKPIMIIGLIPSAIVIIVFTKLIRPIMNDTEVRKIK